MAAVYTTSDGGFTIQVHRCSQGIKGPCCASLKYSRQFILQCHGDHDSEPGGPGGGAGRARGGDPEHCCDYLLLVLVLVLVLLLLLLVLMLLVLLLLRLLML